MERVCGGLAPKDGYSLSQQPGRPKGGALMAIVIGACLLAAATIAQMTSGSLSAGDPELNAIGL